jgi:hypothetical protein
VNQSALAEALRNSRRRDNNGNQANQLGGEAAAGTSNRFNRFGSDAGTQRGNQGQANASILSQQLDSNDARIGRRGFRSGMTSFSRPGIGQNPTNDQVRNFLSMSNRRNNGSRRGDASNQSDGDIANRVRGLGDNNRDGNRRGDNNQLGALNRSGDGERGPNWRGRIGANRDGAAGPDNIVQIGGDRGSRRDGTVNARRGDGQWRDGDGNWKAWRGGDLGKGDHRDWSGKWRDGKRFDVAHKLRDNWRHRDWDDDHDVPFHDGWWKHHGHHRHHRHHHHHHHWGHDWWDHWGWYASFHHRPYYWWDWCSAPTLRSWFVFDWATPYYWDYGPGEYIHCYNNVVYVNGEWYAPATVYYDRTVELAESAPPVAPEQAAQVEWLPLGVFAVSRDGVVDNNVLVQLAVTKDGVISGTVLNQATGESFDVAGTVDKQTQRAAWTYVDGTGKRIAMETSVFNLTQAESTALLQNGPENMQVVELVRLEAPKAEANGAAAAAVDAAQPPAAVDVAKPAPAAAPTEPLPLPIPPQTTE